MSKIERYNKYLKDAADLLDINVKSGTITSEVIGTKGISGVNLHVWGTSATSVELQGTSDKEDASSWESVDLDSDTFPYFKDLNDFNFSFLRVVIVDAVDVKARITVVDE